MKTRLLALLLVLCMVISIAPFAIAAEVPTEAQAYEAMIALKEEYPEGTPWTNDNGYNWNGYSPENGVYWGGGYGCVAFAFMLSDAAFGDLPARELTDITIEDVRVGDILRTNNDTHSVIILEVHEDHVVLAEGNYNKSVHWGRKLTAEEIAQADYMLTRYPETTSEPEESTPPASEETTPPTESTEPKLTGWRKAYYDMIEEGIAMDEGTDSLGWEISNYSLIDINGDDYPELWIDHLIYATGCHLVTITEKGLYSQQMQYSSLHYVEGENVFLHSGGIQGNYFQNVCSIEDGGYPCLSSGTIDDNAKVFMWNGAEVTEEEYWASVDALVDPEKAKSASDNAYSYTEFIELLYKLEAVYGPGEDIPTQPEQPDESTGFTDVVPGSFYEEAVAWAVENGITNGKTETTFAPTADCLRTEVVTFLWRAKNQPVPSLTLTDISFTDVDSGRFYTDAVLWAVDNDITNGMTETTFGVDSTCTRAQVVTFLWRTAGEPNPTVTECDFTDVVPGSFYYDAVLWAVENGITNGMTETEFGVSGTCTRAQIVTFLHRFAG